MTTKEKALLTLAAIAVALAGIVVYDFRKSPPPREEGLGEVAEQDTAGWKTYRNEEYGFEFRYPENYVSCSVAVPPKEYNTPLMLSWIAFEEETNQQNCHFNFFAIQIYQNSDKLTAENWFNSQKGELYSLSLTISNRINISGADSETVVFEKIGYEGTNAGNDYIIQKGDKIITLGHIPNSSITRDFSQILSTFKFIEPAAQADTKTYTNQTFGYSIDYPESWYAYTRDTTFLDKCTRVITDPPVVEFSRNYLSSCGFYSEQLPPADAEITIVVKDTPYNNLADILGPPIEHIMLGGEAAVLYRYSYQQARPNINASRIYFNHGSKGYLIFLKNQNEEGSSYDPIYDQILSTFKFTK